jgi:N-acetylgalactosamine-6-sulfatase
MIKNLQEVQHCLMNMKHIRTSFKVLFLFSFLLSSLHAADKKPNVIFIFADDLGWGDVSCYGNDRIITPSLDMLAKEGTLFTQFYVAGSVCSPSRAGIMSGQYPAHNRIFGHLANEEHNENRGMPNALDPDLYMLTDMFQENGYVTGHFGKWHLGHGKGAPLPDAYGIDEHVTFASNDPRAQTDFHLNDPKLRHIDSKLVFDEATIFLVEHRDRPFYLNIWLFDVHATLNPSKEQLNKTNRFHANGVDFYGAEQVYYATVLEMDRQIGLFIEKLDSLKLRENTLIIFSSDNGPEDFQIRNSAHSGIGSTGPFRGRKRSIYEGGIRVPFILSWEGTIPEDKVNSTSVINGVDFLPTLASIIGAELPPNLLLDGEDMKNAWLGSDDKRTRDCYWEWRYRVYGHPLNRPPMLAVRSGDFKLLMNPDGSRVELYNIIEDPSELQNLAYSLPEMVKNLSAKLLNWNETLPVSPIHPSAGKNNWNWPAQGE